MSVTRAQLIGNVSGGASFTGIVTATSFSGNGANLTGVGLGTTGSINTSGIITATSFSGNGANLTGVGLGTTGSINTSGIITASSFSGNGSGLTGVGGTSVFAAGTAALPSISPTGDSNTGIFFPAADTIAFSEGGAEAARIDSSGRLLVGTSTSRSVAGVQWSQQIEGTSFTGASFVANTTNSNQCGFLILGKSGAASIGSNALISNGDTLGEIIFSGADGSDLDSNAALIRAQVDGTPGANDMPGRLVFSTTADGAATPTERMRISSTGFVSLNGDTDTGFSNPDTNALAVTNGGTERMRISSAGRTTLHTSLDTFDFKTATGAGTAVYFQIGVHSSTSTTAGGTSVYYVWTNGNVQNTNNSYTGISDIKLKENIANAGSQWEDLKALQIRKYNFKEETGYQSHTQIGLIAQEVELVSPGLVSESPDRETIEIPVLDADGNQALDQDGNPQVSTEERETGTVTKSVNYSVLYMKAVKALQEAMERIEQLESAVATLQGN